VSPKKLKSAIKKGKNKPGMVVYACNPSIQLAEAGES
jgi:hypothetical protein